MAGKIIVIEREMLKSEAFRELNGTAKNILFDFLMKCQVKGVKSKQGRESGRVILNNGQLVYPYSEAEKRGITRPAFVRGLDALINFGFIDITKPGSGGRLGDVSLYGISERWRKYGTPDFVTKNRLKDTRQGRGFAAYWERHKV